MHGERIGKETGAVAKAYPPHIVCGGLLGIEFGEGSGGEGRVGGGIGVPTPYGVAVHQEVVDLKFGFLSDAERPFPGRHYHDGIFQLVEHLHIEGYAFGGVHEAHGLYKIFGVHTRIVHEGFAGAYAGSVAVAGGPDPLGIESQMSAHHMKHHAVA